MVSSNKDVTITKRKKNFLMLQKYQFHYTLINTVKPV